MMKIKLARTAAIDLLIVPLILTLGAAVSAQNPQPTVYAETPRKGTTRVTEESLQVNLTAEDPTYKQRIHDSSGTERYELTVTPRIHEGDTKISLWQVSLVDLRHSVYGNLLQFDTEESEDPKGNLWLLNPGRLAPVPVRAKRIIKIDAFYVVFQVKDFHFEPSDSAYLGSMTVQLEFTNSDPRANRQ